MIRYFTLLTNWWNRSSGVHRIRVLMEDLRPESVVLAALDTYTPAGHELEAQSLFMLACRQGYADVVRRLIDSNVDLTELGGAALHEAVSAYSPSHQVVRVLLERGVRPDQGLPLELPPVVSAILKGDVQMVRLLLDYQADVNRRDAAGNSLLFISVIDRQWSVVRVLIEYGAEDIVDRRRDVLSFTQYSDVLDQYFEEYRLKMRRRNVDFLKFADYVSLLPADPHDSSLVASIVAEIVGSGSPR
jgi:hypothetical protein